MAIGSDAPIGEAFRTGKIARPQDYGPWVLEDGSTVDLLRGEATICFVGGREHNVYPPAHHHYLVIDRPELEES